MLLWLIVVLAAVAAILSYRAIIGKFNRQLHAAVTERMRKVFPNARIYIGNVAFNGTRELLPMICEWPLQMRVYPRKFDKY